MRAGAVVLTVCFAAPVLAQDGTFSGQEAAALRCAFLLTDGSAILEHSGRISQAEMEGMGNVAAGILTRYVDAPLAHKQAAFEALRAEYPLETILLELERAWPVCMADFRLD